MRLIKNTSAWGCLLLAAHSKQAGPKTVAQLLPQLCQAHGGCTLQTRLPGMAAVAVINPTEGEQCKTITLLTAAGEWLIKSVLALLAFATSLTLSKYCVSSSSSITSLWLTPAWSSVDGQQQHKV